MFNWNSLFHRFETRRGQVSDMPEYSKEYRDARRDFRFFLGMICGWILLAFPVYSLSATAVHDIILTYVAMVSVFILSTIMGHHLIKSIEEMAEAKKEYIQGRKVTGELDNNRWYRIIGMGDYEQRMSHSHIKFIGAKVKPITTSCDGQGYYYGNFLVKGMTNISDDKIMFYELVLEACY